MNYRKSLVLKTVTKLGLLPKYTNDHKNISNKGNIYRLLRNWLLKWLLNWRHLALMFLVYGHACHILLNAAFSIVKNEASLVGILILYTDGLVELITIMFITYCMGKRCKQITGLYRELNGLKLTLRYENFKSTTVFRVLFLSTIALTFFSQLFFFGWCAFQVDKTVNEIQVDYYMYGSRWLLDYPTLYTVLLWLDKVWYNVFLLPMTLSQILAIDLTMDLTDLTRQLTTRNYERKFDELHMILMEMVTEFNEIFSTPYLLWLLRWIIIFAMYIPIVLQSWFADENDHGRSIYYLGTTANTVVTSLVVSLVVADIKNKHDDLLKTAQRTTMTRRGSSTNCALQDAHDWFKFKKISTARKHVQFMLFNYFPINKIFIGNVYFILISYVIFIAEELVKSQPF